MYSNKVSYDKFYTKVNIAIKCISKLKLDLFNCVIEPSAGNGAFSNNISHHNIIAIDICPESHKIIKQDWFNYKHEHSGSLAVIGNCPFGIRNKLAKAFISKAISIKADLIAFILPDTFRKPTYGNVAIEYKLTSITKLPRNSFEVNEIDYNIPCSFFIWEKNSRKKDLTWRFGDYTTKDFKFIPMSQYKKKKHITVNQAISKVMINSGKMKRYCIEPLDYSYTINILNNIKWSGYSSVSGGARALCQEEIIRHYEREKNERY